MKAMMKTTLCYIENDGKYLMLNRNKKEKDLNEGKWIGIGGKFKVGETPEQCLEREVFEETGVRMFSYYFHGIIHFRSDEETEDMYLYSAYIPNGFKPPECNEGTLAWIEKDKIFELPLWEGDKFFLKELIKGTSKIDMTLEYIDGKLVRFIDHNKALCFTGHKDFEEDYDHLSKRVGIAIEDAYEAGINTFIAGGARGFDTLAAKEVLKLRNEHKDVRLVLALPFRDQPKVEGDWSSVETNLFYENLKAADDVIYVNEIDPKAKYHARDRYMVDHSCKVVSYLRRQHSGTGYTVNYAKGKNREIIFL